MTKEFLRRVSCFGVATIFLLLSSCTSGASPERVLELPDETRETGLRLDSIQLNRDSILREQGGLEH